MPNPLISKFYYTCVLFLLWKKVIKQNIGNKKLSKHSEVEKYLVKPNNDTSDFYTGDFIYYIL